MDARNAAEEFARLFPEAYRRFYRRVPVNGHRLTTETIAVLHHLANTGPLTVTEAANHLGRSQSAMTEMIDRMERRELLGRVQDERDRRRTLVWLTDTGRSALADAQRVLSVDLLEQRFADLDGDQQKWIIEAMRLLIDDPQSNQPREEP